MQQLQLDIGDRPPTILLLGAHCDDIEIGCGGAVLRLAARYPQAQFRWVTFSADEVPRADETRAAAARLLSEVSTAPTIRVENFRTSYFPHVGPALKECFETLKVYRPNLILTHCRHDLHQDHRTVHELTWNTFRDHLILEYEIPKFDGDLGAPNVFIPLTRAEMKRKCDTLLECFPTQRSRQWFTRETFEALARIRGIECNAPEGYAEAFYGRKCALVP
jgi:LmbE family N-acetylglucosaminyl deacetylase